MLAFYLHDLSPFIWEIRPDVGLRWYGFAYVLAFFSGYWLYRWLSQRGYSALPPDKVGDFIFWGALLGVMLGGRLGQLILYDLHGWMGDPLRVFRVWQGGMSSHGGMIGLIVFTYFFARRHGVSWTSIGDNLCVVAPIGLFFGRVANFINGELYGRPAAVAWAVQFPQELHENPELAAKAIRTLGGAPGGLEASFAVPAGELVEAVRQGDDAVREVLRSLLTPRHPSQLYEALLEGAVLFGALWVMRTRFRVPRGVLTGAFFVLYAILRIIGEFFREPELANVGPFTYGQFLSLFLIAIGTAFILYGVRTRRYEQAQVQTRSRA